MEINYAPSFFYHTDVNLNLMATYVQRLGSIMIDY